MHAGSDPHAQEELATGGAPLEGADAALVLVHGRGATARGMLDIAAQVTPEDAAVAALAPQAAQHTWYPHSFLEPLDRNQPGLDSGLGVVADAIATATDAGISRERVVLLGFSQGACLATEYAARNATRYGGVVALSGGLIGPDVDESRYGGDFDDTPVFVGCSDSDPHIPVERVHATTRVFESLGADVDERVYEGMGHGVNQDELDAVRDLVAGVVA
jgi:phospholipase/carboxylesterase